MKRRGARWSLAPRIRCNACVPFARSIEAGVSAGVLMAPIVPGFSSSRSKIERTIKAIADHGARFVGCNVMYLQDGTRAHFMEFLQREFPDMRPRFERLYAKKYPPDSYRRNVKAMVQLLQQRHGLSRRPDAAAQPEADVVQDAEQAAFRW